jgi:hypothetical protein
MPKDSCSPLYEDYRTTTNATILLAWVTLREAAHGRDRAREGNQKLECC